MDALRANILNELQKLFVKKKIIAFLILSTAIFFLSAFFINTIQARIAVISLSSVSFPLMSLSIFTNLFLPLFIFMVSAELFPGEISNKSIKLVLLRPISRLEIFISKSLALVVYIIINLFVIFCVSIFACLLMGGGAAAGNIGHTAVAYLVDIIPAVVLGMFSGFIVQFFKGNSSALITCILCYLAIRILSLFVPGFNNIIFTSYLNWYTMWFSTGSSLLKTANTFAMVISYGVIFFTIGYYLFDRKEV